MRVILPESAPQRKRSPLGTVSSAVIHAALIGGTVVATGWTGEKPPKKPPPIELIRFIPPREPPHEALHAGTRPDIPTNVWPDVRMPPVIPSFHIPDSLPPLDMRIGTMMVDLLAHTPASSRPGSTDGTAIPANNAVLTEATVEKVVVPLPGNAPPRYPTMLANAGVEGAVVMQFVVDTLGRVERESMTVITSSQPQFQQAVRDALTRARFVPAEYAGHRVRQLVEQSFTFALSRR